MPKINFDSYQTAGYYDEMFGNNQEVPYYEQFKERLHKIGWKKLNFLHHSTDRAQLSLGMTLM